jgi:hypothetical protein
MSVKSNVTVPVGSPAIRTPEYRTVHVDKQPVWESQVPSRLHRAITKIGEARDTPQYTTGT